MKRHLTAYPNEAGDRESRFNRRPVRIAEDRFDGREDGEPPGKERPVALASVTTWTHTLVLSGELTYRSAHSLELEIERLCAAGVTGITLDLRAIDEIDAIGAAVIAFRCGLCQRRGYDFTLISGSREVRSAFEQAGVAYLLPPDQPAVVPAEPARPFPLALAHS
jgi:anti-anti-sigma factor